MNELKEAVAANSPQLAEIRLDFSDLEFLRRLQGYNVAEIRKKVPEIDNLSADGILAYVVSSFPDGKLVNFSLMIGGCYENEWPYFSLSMQKDDGSINRIFPLETIDGIYPFDDDYAVNVRVVDRGAPLMIVDSALGAL